MANSVLSSQCIENLRCLSQICFRYEDPQCFHLNSLQCKHLCDALLGLSALLANLGNAYPNVWMEINRAVKEAEIYLQHCSSGDWPIKFLTRSTTGEVYSLHLHDLGLCRLLLDVILRTDADEICRKFSHFDEKMGHFKKIRQEYADEVELIKTFEQFAQRPIHIHTTEDKNIVEVSKFLSEKLKGTISTEVESADANAPIPTWLKIDPADLVLESKIGEGSFGCVYEGSWLGVRVAAKEIPKDAFSELEASILAKLQSPFIVHLIGICIKDSLLYLVMELIGSNLEEFLEDRSNGERPPLSLPVALDIMLQISMAMEYLHSQEIMHLDLKASNVLFELSSVPESREMGYGRAKLCDFGTASPRLFSFRASDPKGTSNWRAPEVFPLYYEDLSAENNAPEKYTSKAEKYTSKADVYSFAMTCHQILTGKQPFQGLQAREIYRKIVKGERPILEPSICPFVLSNYIQQCWDTDPDHRPYFEAVSNFLRRVKLCILKTPLDWKFALYHGFDPQLGFVHDDNESMFSLKRRKWEDANLVGMHSRLDEMLFIWRFLTLEMRREIAIDIASFVARMDGNSAKECLDLCLHSSTIYLDWNLKPIFSGVALGKQLHGRDGKGKQAKGVKEFKNIQDFGGILIELSTGCTWKDMSLLKASMERCTQAEFVYRQLLEETEKMGEKILDVVGWCRLGLWCLNESPSQVVEIQTLLQLLKEDVPRDLADLSSTPAIDKVSDYNLSYIFWTIKEHNIIGSGRIGKVYRVTLHNQQMVAVKKIPDTVVSSIEEIDTLGMIRHPNIIKLLGCIANEKADFKLLVYDYIPNGSLHHQLHDAHYQSTETVLKWSIRYQIAVGAACGLAHLHHDCFPPILHNYMKSSNILLDSDFQPKIADFGLCRRIEHKSWLKLSLKSDVYSFGVVLLELVSGKKATGEVEFGRGSGDHIVGWIHSLMRENKEERVLDRRVRSRGCVEQMQAVMEVGLLCTQRSPEDRPSMSEVVDMLK